MKSFIRIGMICATSLALLPINMATAASAAGMWTTFSDDDGKPRSVIRVVERGGVLSGTIVKILNPRPSDTGICSKCPGQFKNKKIVGMRFMWGLKKSGDNVWSGGKILDPKKGSIYSSKVTLEGRTLKVRGYIGSPMFGRTATWRRR